MLRGVMWADDRVLTTYYVLALRAGYALRAGLDSPNSHFAGNMTRITETSTRNIGPRTSLTSRGVLGLYVLPAIGVTECPWVRMTIFCTA